MLRAVAVILAHLGLLSLPFAFAALEGLRPLAAADAVEPPAAAATVPLGVPDRGIWSDLDPRVTLSVPRWVTPDRTSVVVDKERRTLTLVFDGTPVKTYPVALGFTPRGHKQKEGDGRTPEGSYRIVEALRDPPAARYGARSLRLDYPGVGDAARGRKEGLIDAATEEAIRAAHGAGRMPPQETALGGSIRIHGGGAGEDWTLGCIALRDEDVAELFEHVRVGTPVTVLPYGRRQRGDRDGDGIPDQVDIVVGARKTALNGAAYEGGYEQLAFPGGDVPRTKGVCTDVIVRALRNAGLDLQAALQDDIRRRRSAYGHRVKRPDPNIDHRRVKTLIVWFRAHWQRLGTTVDPARPEEWRPGDVVFFDTFPDRVGPDHVGVLSDRLNEAGLPLVVNAWTEGYTTGEMDLLGWLTVTDHVRIRP